MREQRERTESFLLVGLLIAVFWMGNLLADTREEVRNMRDEVATLTKDCERRAACTYEAQP